jgi:hypothetical protein
MGAKVEAVHLKYNCTITENFCHRYDGLFAGKYFGKNGNPPAMIAVPTQCIFLW